MSGIYRIFNRYIQCEFPLPELLAETAAGHDCAISVRMHSAGDFDASGFEIAYEWINSDRAVICWCERRDDEYLYVFPGHASYLITEKGEISCILDDKSDMQMLRHLLLNQIIPRYLATEGVLVLHASAVVLESGHTVAFLGNSGFGKSTLASSFHRNGAQLIDDDSILLEPGDKGLTAIGGFPGIRLFPDSVQAVFSESSGFTHYSPYTDKQQLLLHSDSDSGLQVTGVLDAMFLLFDPAHEDFRDEVFIEPVSGSIAVMTTIYSAFSLDPTDRQMISRNFRNVGQAINEQLKVYSLHYPRDHERLPEVRAAVSDWVLST